MTNMCISFAGVPFEKLHLLAELLSQEYNHCVVEEEAGNQRNGELCPKASRDWDHVSPGEPPLPWGRGGVC